MPYFIPIYILKRHKYLTSKRCGWKFAKFLLELWCHISFLYTYQKGLCFFVIYKNEHRLCTSIFSIGARIPVTWLTCRRKLVDIIESRRYIIFGKIPEGWKINPTSSRNAHSNAGILPYSSEGFSSANSAKNQRRSEDFSISDLSV